MVCGPLNVTTAKILAYSTLKPHLYPNLFSDLFNISPSKVWLFATDWNFTKYPIRSQVPTILGEFVILGNTYLNLTFRVFYF